MTSLISGAPSQTRERLLTASSWTVGGYAFSQFLRLGNNLFLSYLLVPEAFGLMVLVNPYMIGLNMFSDIGIGPSIIQHPKGDEAPFLRTAWTMQVIRGGFLWLMACLLAWPLSWYYEAPMLLFVFPVVGINAVFAGFNSTAFFSLNRKMQLGKITTLELGSYSASILVMLVWASISPTIWALVAGGFVDSSLKMILGYWFLPGISHRFQWDEQAKKDLFHFGRWIFLSTLLTFLAAYGDRLLLGKMVSLAFLGIYSVAFGLANGLFQVVQSLTGRVLFPAYAGFARDDHAAMKEKIKRIRRLILLGSLPLLALFAGCGDRFIHLWNERYWEAGWILRVLSVGEMLGIASLTLMPIYLALGNSFRQMVMVLIKGALLFGGMLIGGYLGGTFGIVVGIAASQIVFYPIVVLSVREYGIWDLRDDLCLAAGTAILTLFFANFSSY